MPNGLRTTFRFQHVIFASNFVSSTAEIEVAPEQGCCKSKMLVFVRLAICNNVKFGRSVVSHAHLHTNLFLGKVKWSPMDSERLPEQE